MLKRFFFDERMILGAIILNALVIFAFYFPELRDNRALLFIDQIFILFFLAEVIVKIASLGIRKYFERGWNQFDFFIVAGSLPVLMESFIDVPTGANLLILLRLFRVIRLIRFLRFIPNIEQVIRGLRRALKASVFVLAALIFLNFVLAILTCHFYGRIDPVHFGNPLVSAYSIFQMFTLEGWNEIPEAITNNPEAPLSDVMIGLTRFYFVVVVVIGGLFGMSLANAVFVDEMTMDNNRELEAKVDELLKEVRALREGR